MTQAARAELAEWDQGDPEGYRQPLCVCPADPALPLLESNPRNQQDADVLDAP